MKKFAFISRHIPTAEQVSLAAAKGIELTHVGDRDAFTVDSAEFSQRWDDDQNKVVGDFSGVVVVHPAAALRLLTPRCAVGVFENGNRAPEGAKPEFFAKAFHVFSATGQSADEVGSHVPVVSVENRPLA